MDNDVHVTAADRTAVKVSGSPVLNFSYVGAWPTRAGAAAEGVTAGPSASADHRLRSEFGVTTIIVTYYYNDIKIAAIKSIITHLLVSSRINYNINQSWGTKQ